MASFSIDVLTSEQFARWVVLESTHIGLKGCGASMDNATACLQTPSVSNDQSIRFAGGPTGVLLIHGLGGTPVEMRYVASGLARAGFTVHVPQLAGHCSSADDLKATRWQDWYASVDREHNILRKTCDTIVVGGLSMGAVLALHHAAEHPKDIAGTVLYAPCFWLDGWAMPWYSPLINIVASKWLADCLSFTERDPWGVKDPRTREIVKQAMNSGDSTRAGVPALPGGQLLELRDLVSTVKRELASVEQPALILHPRDDDHASLRNLEFVQANLRGRIEAVVLDDSYHIVTIDKQRHLVMERTVQYIERLKRTRSLSQTTSDALGMDYFAMPWWDSAKSGNRSLSR
jgi:carboxylesterase